jgi:uncharacterized membrane protein
MSTALSALISKSPFSLNRKNVGWIVLLLLALYVFFVVDVPLLNASHPERPYFFKVRWALLPHGLLGGIAIVAGPLQFSSRLRRRYPDFHRILGRVYVVSVLIAAPFGIQITVLGPKNNLFTTGVAVHASLWFITTLVAFLTARNRHIVQHRQWMVRSYILTFSFVITRVLSPLWQVFGITLKEYGTVDVILNLAYLLVADIALNWREITTRRA